MPQIITVISDASYREGFGGYAVVIITSNGGKQYSVPVRFQVNNIGQIETMALCDGIMTALAEFSAGVDVIVVAQSDNIQVLSLLAHYGGIPAKGTDTPITAAPQRDELMNTFAAATLRMVREHDGKLYLKHVRGHTQCMKGRSQANRYCDLLAGRARKNSERMGFAKKVDNLSTVC